jgi:hypothetical protein
VVSWVLTSVAVLLLAVGLLLIDKLWPPTPRDVSWLAGRADVPADEARVLRRYLQRHRVHRFAGGTAGVFAATIAGARWGGDTELHHLIFWGIAGVLGGALSAESFRLGSAGGTAVASLEPHDPAPRPGVVLAARLLLGSAAVLAAATWVWRGQPAPAGLVAGGVLVAGLAELTRARIVGRRRPVLSDRARALDTRMRAFAGESVAWLELAAAVLAAALTLAATPFDTGAPSTVRALGALAGLVAAIVFLRKAAPRPPRGWKPAT